MADGAEDDLGDDDERVEADRHGEGRAERGRRVGMTEAAVRMVMRVAGVVVVRVIMLSAAQAEPFSDLVSRPRF
jgi:hypothetical protein